MSKSTLNRQVEMRLLERDVRFTKGRQAVVEALATAAGPLSATELAEALHGAIPLSSLYRSLSVLQEAGVVAHHLGAKGLTRYELAEWLTGHHHHLVCIDCGSVADVEIPPNQEDEVRSLVRQIAAAAAFDPVDHALEIEGHCARCA
ncbi:MAG: Fur family transcriptional regulator [Acidimicrobiia bacterium]|jgi:Fe2+ or Zn2+ uptake regulation protein